MEIISLTNDSKTLTNRATVFYMMPRNKNSVVDVIKMLLKILLPVRVPLHYSVQSDLYFSMHSCNINAVKLMVNADLKLYLCLSTNSTILIPLCCQHLELNMKN